MFSPMAAAAKMITCVAMDMFASEPPWVKGNKKATTKAARISTFLCRWDTPERKPITPTRKSTAMTAPRKARKQTNVPPSSMFSAKADSEERCPHHGGDQEDLEPGLICAWASVGGWSMIISLVPAKAASAPSQRDPAAVLDVDQTPELKRDAEDDEHDVDERPGAADFAPRTQPTRILPRGLISLEQMSGPRRASRAPYRSTAAGTGTRAPSCRRAHSNPYAQGSKAEAARIAPPASARSAGAVGPLLQLRSDQVRDSHARSTTLAPSRPCGLKTSTRISMTKAQTSFQAEPPNGPGM